MLHLPSVVRPVLIEQAVEHPAQFDLLFLCELVADAHQAVPRQAQFSMRVDEILEDIRYVPSYAQPHFHFAGHPLELLPEGVLIPDQDFADGLRAKPLTTAATRPSVMVYTSLPSMPRDR